MTEEHLVECERNWNLELPPAYRDFLACMGVDAGRFSPFAGKEYNFYELLRDPREDYRPQQFSFDTPYGAPDDASCGRVAYSGARLSSKALQPAASMARFMPAS